MCLPLVSALKSGVDKEKVEFVEVAVISALNVVRTSGRYLFRGARAGVQSDA